jgi:hypothetical protein
MGRTAEKTKECVWVKPQIVAMLSLWSGEAPVSEHTNFVGLRADVDPRKVVRETQFLFNPFRSGPRDILFPAEQCGPPTLRPAVAVNRAPHGAA